MNRSKFGRKGDSVIRKVNGVDSHVTKAEAYLIDNYGKTGQEVVAEMGAGTKNPVTGLPEYYDWAGLATTVGQGAKAFATSKPGIASALYAGYKLGDVETLFNDPTEWGNKHFKRGTIARTLRGEGDAWHPASGRWGIFGKSKGRRKFEKRRKKSRATMRETARDEYIPKLDYDEGSAMAGGYGDIITAELDAMAGKKEEFDRQTGIWGEGGSKEIEATEALETTKLNLKRHLREQIQLANQDKLMGSREVEAAKVRTGMSMHGASEESGLVPDADTEIEIGAAETRAGIGAAETKHEGDIEGIRETYKTQFKDPFDQAMTNFEGLFTGPSSIGKQYEQWIKGIGREYEVDYAAKHQRSEGQGGFEEWYTGGDVSTLYGKLDTEEARARDIDWASMYTPDYIKDRG